MFLPRAPVTVSPTTGWHACNAATQPAAPTVGAHATITTRATAAQTLWYAPPADPVKALDWSGHRD